jgi:predicted DNA-binding ArsR family transcriptional regulator
MASGATVDSILKQISDDNTNMLAIIDALNKAPVPVTQAQLDQISNNLDVLAANIAIVSTKVGAVPPPPPPPPAARPSNFAV